MAPQSSQERSREEEAELSRSTKKVKESHCNDSQQRPFNEINPNAMGSSQLPEPNNVKKSFKDKLIGEIPGAYAQAFDFFEYIDNGMESESDSEVDSLRQGVAAVSLSKATIQRIRAPWSSALIIKVFGRSVGYNFLLSKLHALWKPKGKIDCVDLECDYFLIRFYLKEDHDTVLIKGPWFIGEHFLSIRPWEANFRPEEDNIASVAVWVRLPRLPIEYYDVEALKEIGQAIGTVLRIDTHTATEARGRYARLCVQIDINKPLIYTVLIGKFQQSVVYEGIGKLCFSCGRVGHRRENCCYTIKPQPLSNPDQAENSRSLDGEVRTHEPTTDTERERERDVPAPADAIPTTETGTLLVPDHSQADNYGPWLVVTRKKHANRFPKRPSGNTSPKAIPLDSTRIPYPAGTSLEGAHPKDSKRKSSGLESPPKTLPFSIGPPKLSFQGPNLKPKRNHKGKKDISSAGILPLPKFDVPSDQSPSPIFSAIRPCTSSSTPFDGSFKSKSDIPRDDSGVQQLVHDGKLVVVSHSNQPRAPRSESRTVEECAAAISNAALMRIRPMAGADGKEVSKMPSALELHQDRPSLPSDRMNFEEGGEVHTPSR